MVARAFVDALRFGATGGAVLGGAQGLLLDDIIAPDVMGTLLGLCIGAAIGWAVAYAALITGGISADMFGRVWGALATCLVALLCLYLTAPGSDPTSPWFYLPAGGIAAYAALVGWFRVPKILAG